MSRPPRAILGSWYSPGASRCKTAELSLGGAGEVWVSDHHGAPLAQGKLSELDISSRVGRIPRRLRFADGSVFETRDNEAVDHWLGRGGGLIHRLERFHPRLILITITVIVCAIGLYRYTVPLATKLAVAVTPHEAIHFMGQSTLAGLDRTLLSPSQLAVEQQQRLTQSLDGLTAYTPQGSGAFTLVLRDAGDKVGANAFALPDGTIILTDALVNETDDPAAILGVLAHEVGHVVEQHGLRQFYRAASVSALVMFISGDLGSGMEELLATGAGWMMLSYSREQEAAADRYSVELMARAGHRPGALADFLSTLPDAGGEDGPTFLSSHPATTERIQAIRHHAASLSLEE